MAASTSGRDAIDLCLDGTISPEIAIARLLLGGATAGEIAKEVAARQPDPHSSRWDALTRLLDGRSAKLDELAAEIAEAGGDHTAFASEDAPARIAAFFDRQVARSPEASVALYSLGDPAILASATAEIVDWLEHQALLDGRPDLLDLGCGIGRLSMALAPRCNSVLGLDVSAGMVAEARRRCVSLSHVRFEVTSGRDLATLPRAAFDLLLAVDSFPYILQAGEEVTETHLAGAALSLRPGGTLAILNLSYRQDTVADRRDATRWAERYSFELLVAGQHPFRLWDGAAFVLRRAATRESLGGSKLTTGSNNC